MNDSKQQEEFSEANISIRDILESYLKYWRWFLASLLICVGLAYTYLRYATYIYEAEATVMLKTDEQHGGGMSRMGGGMEQFDFMGMMASSMVEDEIEVLKSRRLIQGVVHELNLNVRYNSEGRVKSTELYKQSPIEVQVIALEDSFTSQSNYSILFSIKNIDDLTYEWSMEEEPSAIFPYNKEAATPFGKIKVNKLEDFDNKISVTLQSEEGSAINIRKDLAINPTTKGSKVLQLKYPNAHKGKAADILDGLIEQYNKDAIIDKNQVLSNTAAFIDERLAIISQELDVVESSKEHFKISQGLTNIEQESQIFLQSAKENRTKLLEVNTELELSQYMIDYILESKDNNNLLPANLGFSQSGIDQSIVEFNKLVLERNKVLVSSTIQNPVLLTLNEQISGLKASILQSLNNLKKSLEIKRNELEVQERRYGSQIAQAPIQEKKFRGIERQQEIKETLYLFLLQKREEIAINLAVTAPVAKVIDKAYVGVNPVSPKNKIILLASVLLALLIPTGAIYVLNILDNKIRRTKDLESIIPNATILGETPHLDSGDEEIIHKNDRSVLAESFRIITTNMNYLFVNKPKEEGRARHIQVTSTVAEEGKTLTSFNLALSLAYANKKVLLIGADLRNPQFKRLYSAMHDKGLSDYLFDDQITISEVVQSYKVNPNLSIISSGTIPPNPAELLMSDRMIEFFKEAGSGYDFVIVDTAPLLLVTDTFLINEYADAMVYVVRAGSTEKSLLNFTKDAIEDGKIKNVGFVLNDVKSSDFGYGNKYGYGYGNKVKESLLSKIINKLK